MKRIVALVLAVHVFGWQVAEAAAAPTHRQLISIARSYLVRQGRGRPSDPAAVGDYGSVWWVRFAPSDPHVLDGGVTVKIDKKTHRAIDWWADS